MSRALLALVLLLGALVPRDSRAGEPGVALLPLPPPLLLGLAPQLQGAALALFDQDADGAVRQLTTVLPIAAAPELVREVLVHPEAWPRFLRNVSRSEVLPEGEGRFVNRWRIELPIGHFDSEDRWSVPPLPPGPGAAASSDPLVEVQSLGEGRRGRQLYQLLPLPGGGTLLVQYGYHDGFEANLVLGAMLRRNKSYGAAMALAASLVVVRGVKVEAERRAREAGWLPAPTARSPSAPKASGVGLGALLPRGAVAVVRSDSSGQLLDVSVVKRVGAPVERLVDLVRHPERWPGTIPSVKRVTIERRDARGIDFRIVIDGVLFEIDARFRQDEVQGGADSLGTGGDLVGTRFRWDLSPEGAQATRAVWRGNARLGDASRILRALFRFEPLFEHAANVGAGLIALRAVAARATAPE